MTPHADTPKLEVRAGHRFGTFRLDIAFAAPTGVTVLFGPSGCGKSTALAIVAGLLRPDWGHVALDGVRLLDSEARLMVPPERRRCGMVFQDARLLPHLSVAANLRFGARRAPAGVDGPGYDEVVELLGIGALLRRRPRSLSGGERQRVAIGRALLSRPRLLLMDEPLAALDGPRRGEILAFLEAARRRFDLPILYVTHALDEVDRLADTLVLMQDGAVLASGPMEALMARTDLAPLNARQDAGAVLACRIAGHDSASGLSRLDFAGGTLFAPLRPEPEGSRLRLRLMARDITLALDRPRRVSSRNVLPATVRTVEPAGPHEAFVSLALGPSVLYARLTRHAVGELALSPGMEVFALVKSTMLAN